jgi:uncharacterized phiE125 gp8 family phage protein
MIALNELRRLLRAPEPEDDTYLVGLEAAAVAHMERQTGRYYGAARDRTEYVTGTGNTVLHVDGPIADPVAVTVQERPYPGAVAIEIDDYDEGGFTVRDEKLIRVPGYRWIYGYEYEVTYRQGYAVGSEPGDVAQAVRQLVALWYEVRLPVGGDTAEVPHGVAAIIRANRRVRA